MQRMVYIGLLTLFLLACGKNDKNTYNGYIDTQLVYLSSDFSGRLLDLSVFKGQRVNIGQFLFKLEQTSEQYDVGISQFNQKDLLAQRQQAQVLLNYNEINYQRIAKMRQHNAASQEDLDGAKRDLDSAKQQIAALDFRIQGSQLDTANKKWKVGVKENFAPTQGIIFDTYYNKGEFVQAGFPIVSFIMKDNVKVIFFVPEEALSQIRLNEKVSINTDQNPNFAIGHIAYISNIAEFSPPILYSREERAKLVFRVEAKVDQPDLEQLHLGQPVTLELHG
jgi:HlyD family secretion protein